MDRQMIGRRAPIETGIRASRHHDQQRMSGDHLGQLAQHIPRGAVRVLPVLEDERDRLSGGIGGHQRSQGLQDGDPDLISLEVGKRVLLRLETEQVEIVGEEGLELRRDGQQRPDTFLGFRQRPSFGPQPGSQHVGERHVEAFGRSLETPTLEHPHPPLIDRLAKLENQAALAGSGVPDDAHEAALSAGCVVGSLYQGRELALPVRKRRQAVRGVERPADPCFPKRPIRNELLGAPTRLEWLSRLHREVRGDTALALLSNEHLARTGVGRQPRGGVYRRPRDSIPMVGRSGRLYHHHAHTDAGTQLQFPRGPGRSDGRAERGDPFVSRERRSHGPACIVFIRRRDPEQRNELIPGAAVDHASLGFDDERHLLVNPTDQPVQLARRQPLHQLRVVGDG